MTLLGIKLKTPGPIEIFVVLLMGLGGGWIAWLLGANDVLTIASSIAAGSLSSVSGVSLSEQGWRGFVLLAGFVLLFTSFVSLVGVIFGFNT